MAKEEDIFTFASEKGTPVGQEELTREGTDIPDSGTLRKYIRETLNEGFLDWIADAYSEEYAQEKGRSWFDRLKSWFSGTSDVDEFVEEWINDQELYYDLEFDDETRDKIFNYARMKFARIAARTRGDKQRTLSALRRAVSMKFAPQIRELEREMRRREEEEDEEF